MDVRKQCQKVIHIRCSSEYLVIARQIQYMSGIYKGLCGSGYAYWLFYKEIDIKGINKKHSWIKK
jgi:hypothetical protein